VNARRRYVAQIAAKLDQAEKAKIVAAGGVLATSSASTATNATNLPYTKRRGGVPRRANAVEHSDDDDDDNIDDLDLPDDDEEDLN
jgi:hypothetical protein